MDITTIPGKIYTVTAQGDCTVTCDIDGRTYTLCTASGGQAYFVPPVDTVTISDDSAIITETFKLAPQQRLALLGVLGGNAGGSGLPTGYKRVEYLRSNTSQWIDTESLPDLTTELNIDFVVKSYIQYGMLYGRFDDIALMTTKESNWASFGKKRYTNIPFTPELDTRYKVVHNRTGLWLDDSLVKTFSTVGSFTPVGTISLFSGYGASYHGSYAVYSAKILKDGNIERDFVPALDETGAPCMFDLVSRKPFYNAGTGDFTYPTTSTTYALRRVLPDWGKLTERGLRRLYHAPAGWQGELYDYALENGYKPIVEPEMPEQGYWAPQWRETDEEIILEWVETEPPVDEFLTIPTEQ